GYPEYPVTSSPYHPVTSCRAALLCPSSLSSSRTAGSPLRRDPSRNAGREPVHRPGASGPTLLRQATLAVLAGDGFLQPVRRPRLGCPPGAIHGGAAVRAGDLRLGSADAGCACCPGCSGDPLSVGALRPTRPAAHHGRPALLLCGDSLGCCSC